jgi:hypothetical protein
MNVIVLSAIDVSITIIPMVEIAYTTITIKVVVGPNNVDCNKTGISVKQGAMPTIATNQALPLIMGFPSESNLIPDPLGARP